MSISVRQYARALYELAQDKSPKDLEVLVDNFFAGLVADNQQFLVPKIIKEFSDLWDREEGKVVATIQTVSPVSLEVKEAVAKYLQTKIKTTSLDLQEELVPELLGGFILRYQDKILDASWQNTLKNLKNYLNK
jgi:F-type H+-transporting ATPase subunit delta